MQNPSEATNQLLQITSDEFRCNMGQPFLTYAFLIHQLKASGLQGQSKPLMITWVIFLDWAELLQSHRGFPEGVEIGRAHV